MTRARATADTQDNNGGSVAPFVAGKNIILNGDMAIAQRGVTATNVTGDGFYCIDRYLNSISQVGTWTISQAAEAPSNTGLVHSYKFVCTTARASLDAVSLMIFRQRVESTLLNRFNYGTSNALPMTVSFWVRSNVTGTYNLQAWNPVSGGARHFTRAYTITTANTWEYKTITIPGDTVASLNNGYLAFDFWLVAGTTFQGGTNTSAWAVASNPNTAPGNVNIASAVNNYWQITGLQVEAGSVATPFTTATGNPASELAACQRYYYRFTGDNNAQDWFSVFGVAYSSTNATIYCQHPVTMRAKPTAVDFANLIINRIDTGGQIAVSSLALNNNNPNQSELIAVGGGFLANFAICQLRGDGSGVPFIGFSAEL